MKKILQISAVFTIILMLCACSAKTNPIPNSNSAFLKMTIDNTKEEILNSFLDDFNQIRQETGLIDFLYFVEFDTDETESEDTYVIKSVDGDYDNGTIAVVLSVSAPKENKEDKNVSADLAGYPSEEVVNSFLVNTILIMDESYTVSEAEKIATDLMNTDEKETIITSNHVEVSYSRADNGFVIAKLQYLTTPQK